MAPDEADNIVVGIVRQFQREREEDKAAMRQEREAADLARQEHYERLTGIVEALRKDIFASLAPVQLNQIDHDKIHEADRVERYAKQEDNSRRFDALQRDIRDVRLFLVIGFFIFLGGLIAVAVMK